MNQDLKALVGEVHSGVSAMKAAQEETKTNITKLQTQVDAIDVKMAQRLVADAAVGNTLEKSLKENESVQRLLRDRSGKAVINLKGREVTELMSRKSIISGIASGSAGGDALNPVGTATSGILQIDRIPGITPEARQVLKVRNVLYARAAKPEFSVPIGFLQLTNEATSRQLFAYWALEIADRTARRVETAVLAITHHGQRIFRA